MRKVPCPDCEDGWRVLNPDWPSGDLPHRVRCVTCSGTGKIDENEVPRGVS